jgi:hypothetical protein
MASASGRDSVALAAFALAALAMSSVGLADTSRPTGRAVIRGTGSDITIVYESAKSAATEVRASLAEDPVAEALRLKSGGQDDAAIIAFLRLHEASLPDVIDSEVVRDFRKVGAGPSVISVLLSFAAVDIGETAEGAPVQELPPPQAAYAGAYPDLVGMGYPFYGGGYDGGGYFAGGDLGFGKRHHFGPSFGKHGFRGRNGGHFGRPSFPRPHSSKGGRATRAGRPASHPSRSR